MGHYIHGPQICSIFCPEYERAQTMESEATFFSGGEPIKPPSYHDEPTIKPAEPYRPNISEIHDAGMAMASSSQNSKLSDGAMLAIMAQPELEPFEHILMEWWQKFGESYRDYGSGAADFQGIAGQWGDLYRKIMHIRNWAWSGGEPPKRETPREILMDVIGHAFLAIEMIDRGLPNGR